MITRLGRSPIPALTALLILLSFFAALPAQALDLRQAQTDGATVAEALAIAEEKDWDAALAHVAGTDQLVRDIVLWRKLRAGQGSVQEFYGYISRRGTWPGRKILEGVVLGGTGESSAGLSGQARQNWGAFSKPWKKRRYDAAEKYLLGITASPASLGNPAIWSDRRIRLARRAARQGRHENAYVLASQHHLSPADGYDYSDAEWVAGWVALRKLSDPERAVTHFQRFRDSVGTPISIGRGGYWLGRAYEALGKPDEAMTWYADAAQQQTSFYGQLAAAHIGMPGDAQLTQADLPDWRTHPAMRTDDVRLGVVLHYADEGALAMATFSRLGTVLPPGALGPLARLVIDLGQPHYAVRIAKKAARRGVVIHPAYYPLHDISTYATKVEPAFALAIARQETELNPEAISHAGARGLMQLMPGTAKKVAGWIGEDYSRARLIEDWRYNVRLGETYLSHRTEQFTGSYVMAAAAYNAGASRVDQWVVDYGDPRLGETDMLDWMEQIPFSETRNYVQRVMESLYIYRSRLSGVAGPMTIREDLARGLP